VEKKIWEEFEFGGKKKKKKRDFEGKGSLRRFGVLQCRKKGKSIKREEPSF